MAQGAPDSKGIALIAVIIIILITAIAVLGITSFISNALALTTVRASMEQAISAAQAGIYAAIYDYLLDPALPYWTKVTTPQTQGGFGFCCSIAYVHLRSTQRWYPGGFDSVILGFPSTIFTFSLRHLSLLPL